MMRDMTCDTARRWMQIAHELPSLQARQLNRHLTTCATCAEHHRGQLHMDRLLASGLAATVGEQSVRAATRSRLLALQEPTSGAARRGRRVRPWRWARRPRRAWVLAPVTALLVAAAALIPSMQSRIGSPPAIAGAAWHVVRPNIAYPVTVDPNHTDHLLAGAWGRVYESWNAGGSWQPLSPLPTGTIVRALAVDAAAPHRYLVAVKHSVFISDDSGRHWSPAVRFVPGAMNMFLMQEPRSPDRWYLGPSVLWESTDRGRTWQRAGNSSIFSPNGIQALSIEPDGSLYTGIWGGGVAVSRDGGRTWLRRAAHLAPQVMDVAVLGARIWAGTADGIYVSHDRGLHWRRSGPRGHFFNTSVLDRGTYQLAGGNGGIYRSEDGGKHWKIATKGLPLYSYVYNLVPDPRRSNRVYACLNTDGIFRSDDGGKSWVAVNSGLPLTGQEHAPRSVLFRLRGTLWLTNDSGSDPANLTVDHGIRVASVAPDGAAVAYVTRDSAAWFVRVISAGGSAATTVAHGSGLGPIRLSWSPDSAALVIPSQSGVSIMDLHAGHHHWNSPPSEILMGWSPDGHAVRFWDRRSKQVINREPMRGARVGLLPGTYASLPLFAPDGKRLALITGGRLRFGMGSHVFQSSSIAPDCRIGPWSDDSTRLLLLCGRHVEVRSLAGYTLARPALPDNAFWAPGSSTVLLYFRHGLRRWHPRAGATLLVPGAHSVQPAVSPAG